MRCVFFSIYKNLIILNKFKWFLLTKVLLWSINNLYLLLLISFKEDVVYYE